MRHYAWLLLTAMLLTAPPGLRGAEDTAAGLEFDDAPLAEPLEHPAWFKQSFLELPEDLRQAVAAGKRGIVVYFGQRRWLCRIEIRFGGGFSEAALAALLGA